MMENFIEKLQALANNQDFVEKVTNVTSAEEMLTLMTEYGIQLTESELQGILDQIMVPQGNGELDEDMLDNISGGGKVWNWFKSWFQRRSEKNAKKIGEIIDML